MFEVIFVAFFLLMLAEVLLFLFLNLPFPKSWKSAIFRKVAESESLKTFLKVQLLLCILAGLFYMDMSSQEHNYASQKHKLRAKSSFGAGKNSSIQVPLAPLRTQKGHALLPDPQDPAQQVHQLHRHLHLRRHSHLLLDQAAPLRTRSPLPERTGRTRTRSPRTQHPRLMQSLSIILNAARTLCCTGTTGSSRLSSATPTGTLGGKYARKPPRTRARPSPPSPGKLRTTLQSGSPSASE